MPFLGFRGSARESKNLNSCQDAKKKWTAFFCAAMTRQGIFMPSLGLRGSARFYPAEAPGRRERFSGPIVVA